MTDRLRPLFLAALLTIALVGVWRWQVQRQQARQERKAAWLGYLHGPLSDLLYGTSRLRPLILKKRLSAADLAEGKDALAHLQDSSLKAGTLAQLWQGDGGMEPLVAAAGWHQQVFDLFQPWRSLQGKPLGKDAVEVEADLRRQLWTRVNAQRELMLREKALGKDDILEMNALLYSLKEKE